MCCQTTPAIGIPPMNPITTMRLRFIRKKTSNAERRTPNAESRWDLPEFDVERWALDVGRFPLLSLEFLHFDRRISGNNGIWRDRFRHHRTGSHYRVIADPHAFQDHSIHSDPDVVADFYRRGFQFWPRRPILEERRQRLRVDQPLRGFKRMKIGISDADTPGNQTV